MTTPAIEIDRLTKDFGDVRALDAVDLTVAEGSVFGFLGPNGAGKTTTLRILTGLARPTAGSARIFGRDVVSATNETRSVIGFLPDVPGYYGWMTAREFLRFAGRLFGLSGTSLEERVDALLDLAGLADVETRIRGYSRGMRQRLGIAQALVNSPRLLLLDEPTSALDPMGRKAVLDMIDALKGRTTVFFSTHILNDVERVSDTVAVLDRGRIVMQASIDEIKHRGGERRFLIEVTSGADDLRAALAAEPWTVSCEESEGTLVCTVSDADAARKGVPTAVVARGLALERFEESEPTLEDVFVDLVGGGS